MEQWATGTRNYCCFQGWICTRSRCTSELCMWVWLSGGCVWPWGLCLETISMVNGLLYPQNTRPHLCKPVKGQTLSSPPHYAGWDRLMVIFSMTYSRVDTGKQSFVKIWEMALAMYFVDAWYSICVSYIYIFLPSLKSIIFLLICQWRNQHIVMVNNSLT